MIDDSLEITKEDRLRAWWQRIQKPLEIIAVTLFLVGLLVLIVLIILGYIYNLDWTGLTSGYSKVTTIKTPQGATITTGQLPAKSLWDWLQLLIIPAVLAVGGYAFNITVSRNEQKSTRLRDQTERDIAADNQQEAALQAYIDKMSELLLDKKLRASQPEDEVQKIARVRTLTVLPHLNKDRKKSVLQFLHESSLINKDKPIIVLDGADLSDAKLFRADLSKADLSKADLSKADLGGANLSDANLGGANLSDANLGGANLVAANLVAANLGGADLYRAKLGGANLSDANLGGASLVAAGLVAANLGGAYLGGAYLSGAYLTGAYLTGANLSRAYLTGADLSRADLTGANLSRADLSEADLGDAKHVTTEQLEQAKSLKGATMPDGSKHP